MSANLAEKPLEDDNGVVVVLRDVQAARRRDAIGCRTSRAGEEGRVPGRGYVEAGRAEGEGFRGVEEDFLCMQMT